MEAGTPLIELCDCAVEGAGEDGVASLRGVNWRIETGDWWVVGGLAGSGKTRLLETAAGLRPPAAGVVRLDGTDATALGDAGEQALRRRIGFVYGDGGRLLSQMTVAQNVALPLCYHRNCTVTGVADEVGRLLHAFGLEGIARRLPGQVNAAFRQRTALARALALQPEVLMLHNPLGGLNTAHTRWWLDFLDSHDIGWPRPRTLVVVTDDLRPWLAVARQFALIHGGGWQVLGGRDQLSAAGEPLLRELLAESSAQT